MTPMAVKQLRGRPVDRAEPVTIYNLLDDAYVLRAKLHELYAQIAVNRSEESAPVRGGCG